eukprot:SAG31_NODE_3831_length_3841_cov_2.450561_2_plen_190_part_00
MSRQLIILFSSQSSSRRKSRSRRALAVRPSHSGPSQTRPHASVATPLASQSTSAGCTQSRSTPADANFCGTTLALYARGSVLRAHLLNWNTCRGCRLKCPPPGPAEQRRLPLCGLHERVVKRPPSDFDYIGFSSDFDYIGPSSDFDYTVFPCPALDTGKQYDKLSNVRPGPSSDFSPRSMCSCCRPVNW